MKSLGTLLKVAQRKLDELGIEAAKIGVEVAELQSRENAIRAREQAELANAARDPMFAAMLPAYRTRVRAQIADLKVHMSAKEKALEAIRQKLSEAYIEKAAELANNRELRQSLRNTLREDLTKSTLCDHAAQTTRFEAALRMAWGEWCASQS
jgi:predicted O-linked N-acetylglucosamine transferase (SPINDLY family)